MEDALTQFLFEGRGARGAVVDIQGGLKEMLGGRPYANDVRKLLGEALAASPLLASHLKFEGRINLQFQGDGPVKLLVTQIDNALKLRGMAKADADAVGDFRSLLGAGILALMLEPHCGQTYQAMVSLEGISLAEALENYYAQSEQLPSLIRLAASDDRLCGMMLQRMPGHDTETDDVYWEHLTGLFATLLQSEMLAVTSQTLLYRLFHAESLRTFEPRPVTLACACSRASISVMLLSLGEKELNPLLAERGKVEVTCEFCGRPYIYSEIEVRELLAAHGAGADSAVRH